MTLAMLVNQGGDDAWRFLRIEEWGEKEGGVCCAIPASVEDKICALIGRTCQKQWPISMWGQHDIIKG